MKKKRNILYVKSMIITGVNRTYPTSYNCYELEYILIVPNKQVLISIQLLLWQQIWYQHQLLVKLKYYAELNSLIAEQKSP